MPLTGTAAAVGQDMARAMTLATTGQALPQALDSSDGADAATAAAKTAMAANAKLILGPLRADQVAAVLAVAGQVPVVTFSNDESLAGSGAFIFGVTPAQSVATMFSYAKAQGAKRIALVAADTPFGRSSAIAAQAIAAAGGLNLSATLLRDPAAPGIVG
ncbi:MAG: ABC transporter substrate-binding protein, partial [Paracoccaceae bacterium]